MIGAFYGLGTDKWAGTEDIWEGTFALVASIVITIMGAALLRVSKMQAKWRVKLAKALETKSPVKASSWRKKLSFYAEKYAMFVLPFITVLREGLEAIVFIGGVSLGLPATAIPLPAVTGLAAGFVIGYCIYRGGNAAPLQAFLIASTCFLYLVAAGLFSRAVWSFQSHQWSVLTGGDAAETGSGPGSYDIRQSVWHVNCCSPTANGGGGWGIFNAILGWTNSATYGSVISYNLYWIAVIGGFLLLRFREKRGRWPFMKAKVSDELDRKTSHSDTASEDEVVKSEPRAIVTRLESDDSIA